MQSLRLFLGAPHCHSRPGVPPCSRLCTSGSLARTATRPRACPDPGLALPLAPERARTPVSHCHSPSSVPSRYVHARVAVWIALPLAPGSTQNPPPHCHSPPSVPRPPPCTARRFLVTRFQKEGARVGRIMNMLWLFSFSQSTCHKALPCISACDFCLWRDGRDVAQSYGVSGFCLLEAARSQWLLA